jgi:WD40 repeat protein
LYTISGDKIDLWDKMNNFKHLQTIQLEESFKVASSLILSNNNIVLVPKKSYLVTKSILILDSNNSFKLMKTITEDQSEVYSLVNLPDNKFASGSIAIHIWYNKDYTFLKTLTEHGGFIDSLLYIKSNNILLSGSSDYTIRVCECTNFLCIKTISAHDRGVNCFTLLPNGYFASGSSDKKIKIWDLKNYQCINTLEGHDYSVNSLLLLKDRRLISGSLSNEIIIWDDKSNK